MSVEHRRPLLAFVVITLVCGLFLGYSVRADGMAELVRQGRVVAAAAEGVTLERLSEQASADDPDAGPAPAAADRVAVAAPPSSAPDREAPAASRSWSERAVGARAAQVDRSRSHGTARGHSEARGHGKGHGQGKARVHGKARGRR